ncbi:hypothetical protein MJA45_04400 [Paenibacillus aurantius]|uniref:Uncharacterized protein n=1 Tax=Paenibacillus aurantius TaxID=2918900 RepID=A0AA96REC4_9BACL|nr:hypothetical protein [Paenibacillus aurantius]WNQ12295.1 hypothetical protein MJA45_04400 [Paenibacillus aurantius]
MTGKRIIWILLFIFIILCMFGWYIQRTPKIHGQTVAGVTILDPEGNHVVKKWSSQNKKELVWLAQAFDYGEKLIPIPQTKPTYLVHIEYTSGSREDLLAWLEEPGKGSFVNAFPGNGGYEYGGTASSYPIKEKDREELRRLLQSK